METVPNAPIQSWLIAVAPYAMLVVQIWLSRANRAAIVAKVEQVASEVVEVKGQVNGHLGAMTAIVAAIDPAVAAIAAKALVDAAATDAAKVLATAKEAAAPNVPTP